MPSRTRSDDLMTAGRSERRTSRSSRRRAAIHRAATAAAAGSKASSQRPLMYAYNDNGSMVDVRCEPSEWTANWTPM